jgi:hypothetical protein
MMVSKNVLAEAVHPVVNQTNRTVREETTLLPIAEGHSEIAEAAHLQAHGNRLIKDLTLATAVREAIAVREEDRLSQISRLEKETATQAKENRTVIVEKAGPFHQALANLHIRNLIQTIPVQEVIAVREEGRLSQTNRLEKETTIQAKESRTVIVEKVDHFHQALANRHIENLIREIHVLATEGQVVQTSHLEKEAMMPVMRRNHSVTAVVKGDRFLPAHANHRIENLTLMTRVQAIEGQAGQTNPLEKEPKILATKKNHLHPEEGRVKKDPDAQQINQRMILTGFSKNPCREIQKNLREENKTRRKRLLRQTKFASTAISPTVEFVPDGKPTSLSRWDWFQ